MARQHAHHAAPASFYLDRAALAAQVKASKRLLRRTGQITNELAVSVALIAAGVWSRHRFTADREDFVQEVVLHFLRYGMRHIDPQGNVFSFITTLAYRRGWTLKAKEERRRAQMAKYVNSVIDAADLRDERDRRVEFNDADFHGEWADSWDQYADE